jgi:hypothetical protein
MYMTGGKYPRTPPNTDKSPQSCPPVYSHLPRPEACTFDLGQERLHSGADPLRASTRRRPGGSAPEMREISGWPKRAFADLGPPAGWTAARAGESCKRSRTCVLVGRMGDRLPWWWDYPRECRNGHPWGPGKVAVSWTPCECRSAQAERSRGPGHLTVECRTPGCRSAWYRPRHDPRTAG